MINLPSSYTRGGVNSEETEEEHAVRLARISEEVKADMKAGRYRHGQLKPDVFAHVPKADRYAGILDAHRMARMYGSTVSGRYTSESPRFEDVYHDMLKRMMEKPSHPERALIHEMYGYKPTMMILDEVSYINPSMWMPRTPREEKPEPDWERTRFTSGPETPPDSAKRAKLRAKRKRKGKS